MKIKDKIEQNIVWWSLTCLIIGFVSGMGIYKTILEISNQTTITKGSYITKEELRKKYIPKPSTEKISTITNNQKKYFNDSFHLGFSVHIMLGLLLGKEGGLQVITFNTHRNVVIQKANNMNIHIQIPDDINIKSLNYKQKWFIDFQKEIEIKVSSVNYECSISYQYGRWLGTAMTHVSYSKNQNDTTKTKLLGAIINDFEDRKLHNFKNFNVNDIIKDKYISFNKELVALHRSGKVTDLDYKRLTRLCIDLLNEFK